MSQQLISRSPDLKRLRDEGHHVVIHAGFLAVHGVPYVNARREVLRGTLVSDLSLAGDVTTTPGTHVAYFAGDHPCHRDGSEIVQIKHASGEKRLAPDLVVNHSFSSKPTGGYTDYYHKMTSYIAIVAGPAEALDPSVTAQTYSPIEVTEDESVFRYLDTASSRAEIVAASKTLEVPPVAIIGLGGTGSYVLDFLSKTPAREIHLFDGDTFSQHNAFRSPGAPSIEELRSKPKKVQYLHSVYNNIHRHVIPHDHYLGDASVGVLQGMSFAFVCLDRSDAVKKLIIESLEEFGVPFIDVGMGITAHEGRLLGVLRVTTSTTEMRVSTGRKHRIPLSDTVIDDDYNRNIQICELNALNAALAVVKWKKLLGFYLDLEREHFTTYTVDGNTLINEDKS